MKHNNVALFIPHNGCPHQCSFCNQRGITGQNHQPTADDVKRTIETAIENLGKETKNSEIAFFGGSFTAIGRENIIAYLNTTKPYIDKFSGIRISTRPDYIDKDILDLLKSYNVTTIELGAQSMDDDVLLKNSRGHCCNDVQRASALIKNYGFKLGLQMMTGLYGTTPDKDINTALEFIKLKPDCVRIYPTVVIKNTELAKLYKAGVYEPYPLETSIDVCSKIMMMFYDNNIDVIRVGLHYSDSIIKDDIAHNYHPAFKELCENKIFYDKICNQLKNIQSKKIKILVNPTSVSKVVGQRKSNILKLNDMGYNVVIIKDNLLHKYEAVVKEQR